jgi:hypothetical protein
MNSANNQKGLRLKTVAMTGLGLLLVATASTFSYGSIRPQAAIAQQTEQQQNQTQSSNATTIANATMTDTFTASGVITGTIHPQRGGQQTTTAGNATQSGNQSTNMTQTAGASSSSFLVGGDWSLDVESENVTDFRANFTMVRTDGSEHHSIDITNFRVGNNTQFQLDPAGTSTVNGTADFAVNGTSRWPGTDMTLTIEKARILTIQPEEEEAKQHFQGQPIYGIVLQAIGENGTTIAESAPAGGNQTQQQEGGGGLLENLTKPFEDLFGG